MKMHIRWLTLTLVAVALTSCTGRTILHGMRALPHSHTADARRVNVWFVKADSSGVHVVPVTRQVGAGDHLEQSVRELLEGPNATEEGTGLGTEIPRGTLLLGISKSGANVELNLSRRFAMDGGTTSFETRLEQLKRTVMGVCGQSDVYLSVEGKRLNIEEGEGIEIHQPINR
jgi:spore germination protein GerM